MLAWSPAGRVFRGQNRRRPEMAHAGISPCVTCGFLPGIRRARGPPVTTAGLHTGGPKFGEERTVRRNEKTSSRSHHTGVPVDVNAAARSVLRGGQWHRRNLVYDRSVTFVSWKAAARARRRQHDRRVARRATVQPGTGERGSAVLEVRAGGACLECGHPVVPATPATLLCGPGAVYPAALALSTRPPRMHPTECKRRSTCPTRHHKNPLERNPCGR